MLEKTERTMKMVNPEKLETLGTQDTERKQNKKKRQNKTENNYRQGPPPLTHTHPNQTKRRRKLKH
jgi:hypothetical protein